MRAVKGSLGHSLDER